MSGDVRRTGLKRWLIASNHHELGLQFLVLGVVAAVVAVVLGFVLQIPGHHLNSSQNHFGTLYCLLPLLFAGPGYLLMGSDFGVGEQKVSALGIFSFWLFVVGLCAVVLVDIYTAIEIDPDRVGPQAGSPQLQDSLETNPQFSKLFLTACAFLLGSFAAMLTAASFLLSFVRGFRSGVKLTQFSTFAWSLIAMAVLVLVLIPTKEYVGYLYASMNATTELKTPLLILYELLQKESVSPAIGIWNPFLIAGDPLFLLMLIPAWGLTTAAIEKSIGRKVVFGTIAVVSNFIFGLGILLLVGSKVFWGGLQLDYYSDQLIVFVLAAQSVIVVGGVWLFTLVCYRPRTLVPALWSIGFWVFMAFAIVSTIVLANAGSDRALHDTYYVVAHYQYAAGLSVLFVLFAGWYAFFRELTGRTYKWEFGFLHFLLFFVGVCLTFAPLFLLGFWDMPRRYADYPEAYATMNFVSSIGSYFSLAGTLCFFAAWFFSRKEPAAITAK